MLILIVALGAIFCIAPSNGNDLSEAEIASCIQTYDGALKDVEVSIPLKQMLMGLRPENQDWAFDVVEFAVTVKKDQIKQTFKEERVDMYQGECASLRQVVDAIYVPEEINDKCNLKLLDETERTIVAQTEHFDQIIGILKICSLVEGVKSA